MRLPDGRTLVEANAAIALLHQLGGVWRVVSVPARLLPTGLTNAIYRWVARNRKSMFGTKEAACPILPADLRARFVP